MKLSFSTLGCPYWSWKEILSISKDIGMNGIEVRGIGKEMIAPRATPFLPENIEATVSGLKSANLSIPIFSTGVCLGCGDTQAFLNEAGQYLALAQKTETPYIRVMISPEPGPGSESFELAVENMKTLCAEAEAYGVTVLIETNGTLADSAKMAEFIKAVKTENAGVLWDIHHPYRFFGESPEQTYSNIGKYVKHIHVKDSVEKDGVIEYRMMGYGDVPVLDALKMMAGGGYDGFVSLEWLKRYKKDLQEPGIVFAHYANYINHLLNLIR